jgi:hypothetical protein
MYVAVIGIDRYRAWGRLHNAVRDAEGARDAFVALGFKAIGPQLFDEAATGAALRRLVTDDLRGLGTSDSLVLFFAGHGYTTTMTYPDGTLTKTGYLVPADGDVPEGSVGTWLNLDGWLREVAFQAYRRDRIKDVWLQRAGFFVLRFLADDVEDRLAQTLDEIALALAGRRASGSFAENINDSHG